MLASILSAGGVLAMAIPGLARRDLRQEQRPVRVARNRSPKSHNLCVIPWLARRPEQRKHVRLVTVTQGHARVLPR